MKKRILRSMLSFLLALAGFYLLMLVFLFAYQRTLIFFPRQYDNIHRHMLAQIGGTEVVFTTADGTQEAFYIPALSDDPKDTPRNLWVFFGGNASLALDWMEMVEHYPNDDTAFLLVDYPGYGWSEGRPTRASIIRTAEALLPALAEHLDVEESALHANLNVFGHSMGAAAALEFAVREPVSGIVLISPYTSLLEMARSIPAFAPFHFVVRDRFDNRARLRELIEQRGTEELRLAIFHGADDEIIPSRMGAELAALWGDSAHLTIFPGGDHNWILGMHREQFYEVMMETGEEDGAPDTDH